MSLINDALNRARAEASRREAEDRGETPMPITGPKRPARLSPAIWPAAGVILLALLVWLWQGRGSLPTEVGHTESAGSRRLSSESPGSESLTTGLSEPAPASEKPATNRTLVQEKDPSGVSASTETPRQDGRDPLPSSAAAAAPSSADRDEVVTEPAATSAASAQPYPESLLRQELPTPAEAEAPRALASPEREVQTPPASAPEPQPSETAPSASPAAVWPADGDSAETWYYVGAVSLPGGGSIVLSGIAWSATAPSAMLNGSLLGVGDEILGLTVSGIDRRTVILTGRGQRIALQLGSAQP